MLLLVCLRLCYLWPLHKGAACVLSPLWDYVDGAGEKAIIRKSKQIHTEPSTSLGNFWMLLYHLMVALLSIPFIIVSKY